MGKTDINLDTEIIENITEIECPRCSERFIFIPPNHGYVVIDNIRYLVADREIVLREALEDALETVKYCMEYFKGAGLSALNDCEETIKISKAALGRRKMEKTDINRRLQLALGRCWHELCPVSDGYDNNPYFRCSKCHIQTLSSKANPDYCADPRLVIEAMRERHKFREFVYSIIGPRGDVFDLINLIMDRTGKFASLALEWIEGRQG